MTNKSIERTPHKRITKKQLRQLAAFTDSGTILAALAKEGWSIEESIQHLVTIAKGEEEGTKTSTQLNAIKYLNQLIIDTMERSGLMVMATKKFVGEDGEEVRFSGHVVSSVLEGQREQTTPAELSENPITKENDDGQRSNESENGEGESGKNGEERQESDLHSSKAPTGREARSGHFDGISKEGEGNVTGSGAGDFV